MGVLKATLQKLNPTAKIIEDSFSKVNPKEILNTGLFNFEEAEQNAGWIEELNNEEHTPETEEYGINSFVFRSKIPFHSERFWEYVKNEFPQNIIRSKGLFWITSRPEQALVWGQAGGSLRSDSAGVWWSSMKFQDRIKQMPFVENQQQIEADWHPIFGDRKNEIVFIGQHLDEELIRKQLTKCLLSNSELTALNLKEGFKDDWPVERAYAY